jgi:DNA-binding GntR family transcriptional regulator
MTSQTAGRVDGRRSDTDKSPWRVRFNTIYQALRERITLLKYPPGMRLDVDALAAEYGVSRTPIRNVLLRLEQEGLVATRHGVGTTVTEIDFRHLRDVVAFRVHLAELIGKLDPLPPGADTLREMDELTAACHQLVDAPDLERFAYIDIHVHDCISRLIGNQMLRRTYDELYFRNARMWFYFLPRLDVKAEIEVFLDDIRLTGKAMKRGDVEAVGYITRNAISAVLYRLDDLLDEATGG